MNPPRVHDRRCDGVASDIGAAVLVLAILAVCLLFGQRAAFAAGSGSEAAAGAPALASAYVPIDAYPYPADVVKQPAVVSQCLACHGPVGITQIHDWPNLAGQHAIYLTQQLQAYKSGARQHPMMQPVVAVPNDADFKLSAAYFSAQQAAADALRKNAPAAAAPCMACHNPAVPHDPSWPRIAGQKAAYLAAQLRAFRSGARKSAVMNPMAKNLSDDAITALAEHFAGH